MTALKTEIDQRLFPPLLQVFFLTYSYYHDRKSRRAVERCIRAIFSSGAAPEALAGFIKAVHTETSKPGLAPSNAFVLVEWCSALLQVLSDNSNWERWGLEIIVSNGQALELCHRESSRSNVKQSALVVTWRGLRKAFSSEDTRQKRIDDALNRLSSKENQPAARNAIMLGAIAGVCARKPVAKDILSQKKSEFYSFYNREIIGSRTPVPAHIANGLHDFFVDFTTKDDMEKEIVPSLEKALLRAPEIVLNDLVTPLFRSLSDSVDLSTILRASLLKPLLANAKSTNATIRNGALSAFKAAVLKCHQMDVAAEIAEEILAPMKSGKLPSAEQRAIHADMLAALPVSNSTAATLAPGIAAVAGKEANEATLGAETLALLQYLKRIVLNSMEIDKPVIDAFLKGISDKKVPIKKLWTVRLGELLWVVDDPQILKSKFTPVAEAVAPPLLEIWQEATANPISAAQSGIITAAYVFAAISHAKLALTLSPKVDSALKKAQVARQSLTMEPKPSFLLNHRIYGKLSSEDDFRWFIRALFSLSQDLVAVEPDSAIATGWSQAIIFCICSSNINPTLRRDASQCLSRVYVSNPAQVYKIIVAGLWRWRYSIESGEKDSAAAAAKTENQNLHLVVKAICLPPADVARLGEEIQESVLKDQMVSLLVLSRQELLPRVSWIDLCLRTEVDPGDLARFSGDSLIQQIMDYTNFKESVSITRKVSSQSLELTSVRCPSNILMLLRLLHSMQLQNLPSWPLMS